MAVLRGPLTEHGAITEVVVGPSQLARESIRLDDLRLAKVRVRALFDTGADSTLIHVGLPERIGIAPHGTMAVLGVHGHEAMCPVYDVDLEFGGRIVLRNVGVVETQVRSRADGVELLIGRSALWRGVFRYHGLPPTPYFEFEVP